MRRTHHPPEGVTEQQNKQQNNKFNDTNLTIINSTTNYPNSLKRKTNLAGSDSRWNNAKHDHPKPIPCLELSMAIHYPEAVHEPARKVPWHEPSRIVWTDWSNFNSCEKGKCFRDNECVHRAQIEKRLLEPEQCCDTHGTLKPQGAPGLCEGDGLGPPRRSFHMIFGCCLWHSVYSTPLLYVIAYWMPFALPTINAINRSLID